MIPKKLDYSSSKHNTITDSLDFLTVRPCRLSHLASTLIGTQYPHRADENFCWSSNTRVSIYRGPSEKVTYEFVPTLRVVLKLVLFVFLR